MAFQDFKALTELVAHNFFSQLYHELETETKMEDLSDRGTHCRDLSEFSFSQRIAS